MTNLTVRDLRDHLESTFGTSVADTAQRYEHDHRLSFCYSDDDSASNSAFQWNDIDRMSYSSDRFSFFTDDIEEWWWILSSLYVSLLFCLQRLVNMFLKRVLKSSLLMDWIKLKLILVQIHLCSSWQVMCLKRLHTGGCMSIALLCSRSWIAVFLFCSLLALFILVI